MAFDPARLQVQLLNTQLQSKDSQLYQLLNQIIASLSQLFVLVGGTGGSGGGGGGSTVINNTNIQQLLLSRTKQKRRTLLMGIPTGLIPDNGEFVEWSVLTNGDADFPELIFADGDVIMTHTP